MRPIWQVKEPTSVRCQAFLVGVTVDAAHPRPYRWHADREQHIRREKARRTSAAAQVLLPSSLSMYAVFHGLKGLQAIAGRVHIQGCTVGPPV